jgi:hypothetical protein
MTALATNGDNLYLLGFTAPDAKVTIQGKYINATETQILKTISAGAQGIFKISLFVPVTGIYFFTVSAEKDGVKANKVTFTANISPDVTVATIFNIEVPFPQDINGNPEECERKPDINGDGKVDLTNFSILLSKWRTFDCRTDLDGSGRVDLKDLEILLKA